MKTFDKTSAVFAMVVVFMLGLIAPSSALAATSPTLGTADSFSILAKTLISDVPTSVITGNVGLDNAGSNYSGLTTGEVSGTIYDTNGTGPDGVAGNNPSLMTSARAGNTAAFGALSAGSNAPCTVNYGAVETDLSGKNLVPGVYCAEGAGKFKLTGTLTLSGSGVWIFRSGSTLITSGTAKVVGGNPCSVWWKVPSSATLGTNTSLIGNILALTSITMDSGASLNGRVFAQTGAVTLDSNTITKSTCTSTSSSTSKHHHHKSESKSKSKSTVIPKLPNAGFAPDEESFSFAEFSNWIASLGLGL